MDLGIWLFTIFLECAILGGILWRGLLRTLPWFTSCIVFCALESLPLADIRRHGTANDYFYAYYAFDLINIAFYVNAIIECFTKGYLVSISMTMTIYIGLKLVSYLLLFGHATDAALILHGDLRYANIACYLVWAFLIYGYDVFGIHSRTR